LIDANSSVPFTLSGPSDRPTTSMKGRPLIIEPSATNGRSGAEGFIARPTLDTSTTDPGTTE